MPTKRVKGKKKLKSIKAKQSEGMGSKRRLAKLGKEQKKGYKGSAANYMTRSQALKRLQVTLRDFRKLCILKGIYPRDPKKKAKGHSQTYYYTKDIMYLAHEPVLNKFREMKTFLKKMNRAIGRNAIDDARRRHETKPEYTLDHIVKERYPQFIDAISDLDDALCLIHLFAMMPASKGIDAKRTTKCLELVREWQNYVVQTHSLTRVFVSIKGIYYQARVVGQDVTWLVPHQFTPTMDTHVDINVMMTFLEFYEVLLKFVNFKLYSDLGVRYPPQIDLKLDQGGVSLISSVKMIDTTAATEGGDEEEEEDVATAAFESSQVEERQVSASEEQSKARLSTVHAAIANLNAEEDDEEASTSLLEQRCIVEPLEKAFASNEFAQELHKEETKEKMASALFSGLRFFLSRECPHACLELVIRSFGGTVGWEGAGSPFNEKSDQVTHHLMDRPSQGHRYFNREYIQPQWVFDSVNTGMLLPVEKYAPGEALPPHLSPFVNDQEEGYIPEYRKKLDELKSAKDMIAREGDAGDSENDDESDEDDETQEEMYRKGLEAERQGIPFAPKDDEEDSDEEDSEDDHEIEEPQEPEEETTVTKKRSIEESTTTTNPKLTKKSKKAAEDQELKELAKSMMSKKAKRLYDRMHHGIDKKSAKVQALEDKRRELSSTN